MNLNPLTAIDFYKSDHRRQYPPATTEVYSNLTPRSFGLAKGSKIKFDKAIIFFGLGYFIKSFLIETWNNNFFAKEKKLVISEYKKRMDNSLGKNVFPLFHIEALHDIGYLPIKIKALEEGSKVPVGVPVLTIVNTHPNFFWLTNYLETVLLSYIWKASTVATLAYEYKKLLIKYALQTGSNVELVDFQGHDFSFRGLSGPYDAALSGAAHLTSFKGTDTVPAIDLLERYYNADTTKEIIGCSVPATEHSVMSMGTEEGEFKTYKRLISELYPNGIVSIVSDTWNIWRVLTEYLPQLKNEIMSRNGKVVIRPDSGDPLRIITGDPSLPKNSPEGMGVIGCLWHIFGGTLNDKKYKILDPHIGIIYGDSMTIDLAKKILDLMKQKGYASENIVFGIGAHSYQYLTRDSLGFAMKSTSGMVNNIRRNISKRPVTDSGLKKSATGLLRVEKQNGKLICYDNQTEEQEKLGLLREVFKDGKIIKESSLTKIRKRINSYF